MHRQNLSRAVACRLRMGFTEVGDPKVVLLGAQAEFHPVNTPWFSRFVASILMSRLNGFRRRNVLESEPFKVNWSGPASESRRAVPHAPLAGAAKAFTFK